MRSGSCSRVLILETLQFFANFGLAERSNAVSTWPYRLALWGAFLVWQSAIYQMTLRWYSHRGIGKWRHGFPKPLFLRFEVTERMDYRDRQQLRPRYLVSGGKSRTCHNFRTIVQPGGEHDI